MREADLIAKIRARFPRREAVVGIGDDAAVISAGADLVVTTDLLVEGVDFLPNVDPALLARKSLAVNLSDVAAMGARPVQFTLALVIPPAFQPKLDVWIEALAVAARDWDVELIGGDVSRGEILTIAVTAFGHAGQRLLLRSGAKPGDRIYVSRPIGASGAGLSLLLAGWNVDARGALTAPDGASAPYTRREFAASAILRHLAPEPEIALGIALAELDLATAAIDISDGLSTDLHRLCEASGVGAVIEKQRLPLFPDLLEHAGPLGIDVQDVVLHGGEEYALLFTSSQTESQVSAKAGRPVYAIGRITAGREVLLRSEGVDTPLEPRGFDHFA